jgi:hypothetical protein
MIDSGLHQLYAARLIFLVLLAGAVALLWRGFLRGRS